MSRIVTSITVAILVSLICCRHGHAFASAFTQSATGVWKTLDQRLPRSGPRTFTLVTGDRGRKPKHKRKMPATKSARTALVNADSAAKDSVKLGFIGCGTIASAIATGLAKQSSFPTEIASITVSKRSEKKSTALQDAYPMLIEVSDDNQFIIENSDVIFLCVLPQQEKEVLAPLKFDIRHTLVSLVATSKLNNLAKFSGLPMDNVYKMICLPPVAELDGTCLLMPKGNTFLKSMFQSLGGCVECETEQIMNSMMIPGCLMGPMYGILKNNRDWLIQQGVPAQDASYFVGRQYLGILKDAERGCDDPDHFDRLIAEQTPGGLNEQALTNLEEQGVFEAYDLAMDAILGRIDGKSDGFISPKEKSDTE